MWCSDARLADIVVSMDVKFLFILCIFILCVAFVHDIGFLQILRRWQTIVFYNGGLGLFCLIIDNKVYFSVTLSGSYVFMDDVCKYLFILFVASVHCGLVEVDTWSFWTCG